MKRPDNLYRPSRVIHDVRQSSSYFRSPDVALSPFSRIGDLVDLHEPEVARAPATLPKRNPLLPRPTVFPAGFMLNLGRNAEPVKQPEHTPTKKKSIPVRFLSVVGPVGTAISAASLALRHATAHTQPKRWLPKTYTITQGVRINKKESVKQLAKVSAPILAMLLLLILTVVLKPDQVTHSGSGTSTVPPTPTSSQTSSPGQTASTSQSRPVSNTQPSNSTQQKPSFSRSTSPTIDLPIASTPTSSSITSQPIGLPVTTPTTSSTGTTPVGGYGGGPTNTSSTGSTGIPGITSPYPVTVPETSLGIGGKQLVGTSPITITLN